MFKILEKDKNQKRKKYVYGFKSSLENVNVQYLDVQKITLFYVLILYTYVYQFILQR